MSDKIRILIADDHPVVRRGLRAVLGTRTDMEVVGEAADGDEAVVKARTLAADVILMDLLMPRKDGAEAISEIRAANPEARILVLTSFGEDEKIFAAIEAGALGYLLKDSSPDQLIESIQEVNQGKASLHPAAAKAVIERLHAPPPVAHPLERLSRREGEVLALIRQGLSNQQIAARLFVREHTAAKHVSRILEKLDVENRTQAALLAERVGLEPSSSHDEVSRSDRG